MLIFLRLGEMSTLLGARHPGAFILLAVLLDHLARRTRPRGQGMSTGAAALLRLLARGGLSASSGCCCSWPQPADPAFLSLPTQVELSTHVWELALLALPMTLIIITAGD